MSARPPRQRVGEGLERGSEPLHVSHDNEEHKLVHAPQLKVVLPRDGQRSLISLYEKLRKLKD